MNSFYLPRNASASLYQLAIYYSILYLYSVCYTIRIVSYFNAAASQAVITPNQNQHNHGYLTQRKLSELTGGGGGIRLSNHHWTALK